MNIGKHGTPRSLDFAIAAGGGIVRGDCRRLPAQCPEVRGSADSQAEARSMRVAIE
jgi:hypothetical protein